MKLLALSMSSAAVVSAALCSSYIATAQESVPPVSSEATATLKKIAALPSVEKAMAAILLPLGFIVIYDAAEIDQDVRTSIASVHSGRTFDLDRENLPADNAAAALDAFQTIKKWLATIRKAGGS